MEPDAAKPSRPVPVHLRHRLTVCAVMRATAYSLGTAEGEEGRVALFLATANNPPQARGPFSSIHLALPELRGEAHSEIARLFLTTGDLSMPTKPTPAGIRAGAKPARVLTFQPVPVYAFADLTGAARERALEWLCTANTGGGSLDNFAESSQEDLEAAGFTLKTRRVRGAGSGKERAEPCFYYSLSSSQGDGVAFEGRFSLAAVLKAHDATNPDGLEKSRPDMPRLGAATVKTLSDLLELDPAASYIVVHEGNYYHSRSMEGELVLDFEGEGLNTAPLETDLGEWVSDLSSYFESQGYAELEYLGGEKACAESAEANGYTFTAEGSRQG